jgi:hypothetical protein
MFAFSKISSIFALFSEGTILRLFVCVAFLFATNSAGFAVEYRLSISDDCCASKPVIVPSKTERGSLSSYHIFNNLNFSFMEGTMKNASANNHSSTSRVAHVTSTPDGATSVPTIRVTVTGVRNNPYLFAIRKAFYEVLVEETQGHIFAELRFVKKFEAANLLYPEHREKLRGKNVTIKTH